MIRQIREWMTREEWQRQQQNVGSMLCILGLEVEDYLSAYRTHR